MHPFWLLRIFIGYPQQNEKFKPPRHCAQVRCLGQWPKRAVILRWRDKPTRTHREHWVGVQKWAQRVGTQAAEANCSPNRRTDAMKTLGPVILLFALLLSAFAQADA